MKTLKEKLYESGSVSRFDRGIPLANHFIGGAWREEVFNRDSTLTDIVNPTTTERIGIIIDASPTYINQAFRAARIAQEYWHRKIGPVEKREVFDAFIRLLELHRPELVSILIWEMGKTAYTADADDTETIHAMQNCRDLIHNAMAGEFRPSQLADKYSLTEREPLGVVLGIKPWNFLALPWWTIGAALTGGNAVVMKISEETPFMMNATAVLFQEALREVLGDEADEVIDILQIIHGRGETVGNYAAEHGDYDMLSFTGGVDTARILSEICGRRMKRFHSEMGGHAAIVVTREFPLEKAADEIVLAAFGDAGQRCVTTKVVFADSTIAGSLLELVIERTQALRIGDPADVVTKVGPLINREALGRVCAAVKRTAEELGRDPILGGCALRNDAGTTRMQEQGLTLSEDLATGRLRGYFMAPTIFTDVPYGVTAMDKEIFGPVLCFNAVEATNSAELIEKTLKLVNQSQYGLSNACLTYDTRLALRFAREVESGIVYIGRGTTGAEVPGEFGGVKDSGHGREASRHVDEYTQPKQIWLDVYPETRLAQTGELDRIAEDLSEVKSIFSQEP